MKVRGQKGGVGKMEGRSQESEGGEEWEEARKEMPAYNYIT